MLWRALWKCPPQKHRVIPRLPGANQDSLLPLVWRGISRFPHNELVHMPGSSTTPGRPGTRVAVPVRIAFRLRNGVGAQGMFLRRRGAVGRKIEGNTALEDRFGP